MAFAAYLPENAILVLSLGGAFSPFFKAPPWGFCINRPAPPWGICSFSKQKSQMPKGGGWGGHVTES